MAKTIRRVTPKKMILPKRKRVCAYARVSSGKDAMLHSLSAQVSYYSGMIQRNPEWLYLGVYADEAVTGTKSTRVEFQRMLMDCRAGKIDMILTKSITRFARNTVTLLETARELKELGVDIYFEKENIHSISGDGELMLTLLASFAQEESLSVSENCKWRIRKEFETGNSVTWRFMYGFRINKGRVEIHPAEATVVQRIFQSYVAGIGTAEIARELRKSNVPTYYGSVWSPMRIVEMLKNERYAGNALNQKEFISDHLSKTSVRNHGELPMYYAENSHPAIISVELFEEAQRIMEMNRLANHSSHDAPNSHVFTGKIICDKCGKKYKRITKKNGYAWNCSTYQTFGKAYCHTKQIPEDILMEMAAAAMGLEEFDEDAFLESVQEIHVPAFNHLVFCFKDGTTDERVWQDRSRRESWTPEMKEQAAQHARRRYASE